MTKRCWNRCSIRKGYVRKHQNLIGCNCRVQAARLQLVMRASEPCHVWVSVFPGSCRAQPSNEKRRADWGSGNWILPVLSPGHVWRCGCALFRSSRQTVSVLHLPAATAELVREQTTPAHLELILLQNRSLLCVTACSSYTIILWTNEAVLTC